MKKNLLALLFGCALSLLLLEGGLRLLHPLGARTRGDRISLARNVRIVIENDRIPGIDRRIVHTRNSLGFRGADPQLAPRRSLGIVAVGGSTTECYYLSDGKTWPEVMGRRLEPELRDLWVNNAGLDGHSTYGHLEVLRQLVLPLHPKVVLFLVGANDRGISRHTWFDRLLLAPATSRMPFLEALFHSPLVALARYSESCALVVNVLRVRQARQLGLHHGALGHDAVDTGEQGPVAIDRGDVERAAARLSGPLQAYGERLTEIARTARGGGSEPVFITQPSLLRGEELAELEAYNERTRETGRRERVTVIDLARDLQRDRKYYYDFYHFTNEGAEAVAAHVVAGLRGVLRERFPEHFRTAAGPG